MYTSASNIASKLGKALTANQTAYFSDVLGAAIDTYINRQTETEFGTTEPTTVYVDGSSSMMMVIPTMHDITAVTSLQDDGSDDEVITDYVGFPRGDVDKYALRKLSGSWREGFENYKIVGCYGYKDIPADIVEVATDIAVNTFNANLNNYKQERVGEWLVTYGDMEKNVSDRAKETLLTYRRISRGI